ncbi:unnamed protein product [Nippostrongylus brasiliensis]|uniref:DUF1963 domain-containing protein n=1 Tax=Nippostrongylus brasiliensis TaxID=27835 RepID=A0A0N4YM09_NIPBR|nr:unnamed protein product [Nippostrongylus brasiliensis]
MMEALDDLSDEVEDLQPLEWSPIFGEGAIEEPKWSRLVFSSGGEPFHPALLNIDSSPAIFDPATVSVR